MADRVCQTEKKEFAKLRKLRSAAFEAWDAPMAFDHIFVVRRCPNWDLAVPNSVPAARTSWVGLSVHLRSKTVNLYVGVVVNKTVNLLCDNYSGSHWNVQTTTYYKIKF